MRGLKTIRLKAYDYSENGYYFVTIVAKQRSQLFKDKEKLLESELADLIAKVKGLSLDYFVVMPNHVHIIFVLESCELTLGEIVRRFKAKVSHSMGQNVWQPNYYEHVIRSDQAVEKIREYIINNPAVELLKFEQFYK